MGYNSDIGERSEIKLLNRCPALIVSKQYFIPNYCSFKFSYNLKTVCYKNHSIKTLTVKALKGQSQDWCS